MSFRGAEIRVRVTADIAQLKEMIKDFKEGKISAEQLAKASDDVKGRIKEQSVAYSTLTRAQRIQNFETLQLLRTFRSATSLFSDLNQVYQTLQLRQIAANQSTFAQREAFKRLQDDIPNLLQHLQVLGANNTEVVKSFEDLIDNVEGLSTSDLKKVIEDIQDAAFSGKFVGEDLDVLVEALGKMKEILKEKEFKDSQKSLEDFFGIFAAGGTAIASIGTFAVNMQRAGVSISSLTTILKNAKAAGVLGIILALLFGPEINKEIPQAGGDKNTLNPDFTPKGIEDFPGIQSRFGSGPLADRLREIQINFNNNTFSSDVDVTNSIKKALTDLGNEKIP